MESWIFYSLLSAFFAWFYSFAFKVIAERNYDTNLANLYMYLIGFIISFSVFLFLWWFQSDIGETLLAALLGFFLVWFYNMSIHARVESMKNIDGMIFYPLYKAFWPIIVTCISLWFFNESLSFKEWLGILCWISIPLLLITKTENRIQRNLYRWCVFMLATSVLTALAGTVQKYWVTIGLDINLFLSCSFFFGVVFSAYWYYKSQQKKVFYNEKWIFIFSVISWFFFIWASFSFFRALEWNFAIATTINSFSILIPIILSIIFYWEHFNFKKGIVIALSIVSILLFI